MVGIEHQHLQSASSFVSRLDWQDSQLVFFPFLNNQHYLTRCCQFLVQKMRNLMVEHLDDKCNFNNSLIEFCCYHKPISLYPSCLQTTAASGIVQSLPHTVPHTSLKQISTRPSSSVLPPLSLMSPLVQAIFLRCINSMDGVKPNAIQSLAWL